IVFEPDLVISLEPDLVIFGENNIVIFGYLDLRRMIPEPGDAERVVNVNETFHEETDDELSEKELKQIEADDSDHSSRSS
nr:hypothetical protein [Tanacetum cinerariifolium]